LVIAALPPIQDDPTQMLLAATLLLQVGPAMQGAAGTIVEQQLQQGSAIVAATTLRGQLCMYRGGIFECCLSQAGADDDFRTYLLIQKAHALLAAGRPAAASAVAAQVHA